MRPVPCLPLAALLALPAAAQDPAVDPRHPAGTPGGIELVPAAPEDDAPPERSPRAAPPAEAVPPTAPVAVELVGVPVEEEVTAEAGVAGPAPPGPPPSPHARHEPPAGAGAAAGAEDFLLGRGGPYVGPGDTVPPGGGGGGPASPVPGSPAPSPASLAGAPRAQGPPVLPPEGWDPWCDELLRGCHRRPGETPEAMFFRFWGDNPFELACLDAVSTFAADADTASYALARGYVERGLAPPRAAVRTEEVVNAFRPDVPPPREQPFLAHFELAPSRFGGDAEDRWMLRVSLRGRVVEPEARPPLALVLVVDTSGSMQREDRLALVVHGLRMLRDALEPDDVVGLVAFSTRARAVLAPTPVADRAALDSALDSLVAGGSTNAGHGLELGYAMAADLVDGERAVRVVLLSDGVANTGVTDQRRILDRVAHHREAGVYLNCFGVGMGNHDDAFLEQLADRGDGLCAYVDDAREARRRMVEDLARAFVPIARDVKLQTEFDPRCVERWRLLGYENRALADHQFRDDAVDAGELGSGHQVTALYELDLLPDTLDREEPVATLRVRWKPPFGAPDEDVALEASAAIRRRQAAPHFHATTAGYRRAVLAAQWAEHLRESRHARADDYGDLLDEAARLARACDDPDVDELWSLIERTPGGHVRGASAEPLALALDEVRHGRWLQASCGRVEGAAASALLRDLEARNDALEEVLREVLRAELRARWEER